MVNIGSKLCAQVVPRGGPTERSQREDGSEDSNICPQTGGLVNRLQEQQSTDAAGRLEQQPDADAAEQQQQQPEWQRREPLEAVEAALCKARPGF